MKNNKSPDILDAQYHSSHRRNSAAWWIINITLTLFLVAVLLVCIYISLPLLAFVLEAALRMGIWTLAGGVTTLLIALLLLVNLKGHS